MKELFKFLLGLFYEWAASIRDKERNAEAKQHVADARERADERLADMSDADKHAVLERLHKHGRSRGTGSGNARNDLSDDDPTDPRG